MEIFLPQDYVIILRNHFMAFDKIHITSQNHDFLDNSSHIFSHIFIVPKSIFIEAIFLEDKTNHIFTANIIRINSQAAHCEIIQKCIFDQFLTKN